ncbi:hypothetical protein TruAng_005137 [Truncatella angustata]|nr:hypothetical protein TruAng_005137 [Truncatella angustata]
MSWSRVTCWALAASVASLASAQYSGWIDNQVNATMCSWQNPRVAVMRDTAYIDGGWIWWTPGLADGTPGPARLDGNPSGNLFLLNFSKPFNTSGNASEAFDLLPKGYNGLSFNNLAPNYFDGALLGNDNEFFMYGGLLTETAAFSSTPGAESILGYHKYQYGAQKPQFSEGFLGVNLPDGNLTRYSAFGGAANAPSENKAYYFSGLHSPLWGELYIQNSNASVSAINTSDSLITLDMTNQGSETWSNITLPDSVKGRGGADLVWVPVGEQGILVSLGGVTNPDFSSPTLQSLNLGQSVSDSPAFMSDIDIYDIAGNQWYKQQTIAGPSQLALGCAVVAVAQDASSYNIYYYGGYDGVHSTDSFNDDVWILSLPSFMWMKVSSGKADHARAGHRCVKPYPDQMIVIGGYTSLQGSNLNCVEGGVLQIFNLTEGKWMETYDPEVYSDYGVPEMIHLMIGGDAAGGATMTVPTPTGWATPALSKVFENKYPTSKIINYYPYAPEGGSGSRENVPGGSSVPSWLAPVLGVVLGLVFISAIVVAILLYRRRKFLGRGRASEGPTEENGNRILSWMRGQDVTSHKAQTVTSDTMDEIERSVGAQTPYQAQARPEMVQQNSQLSEMPYTPLFEMMDTSPRAELENTGLTPVDIINKHTHFARSPHSVSTPTNPSSFSNSNYAVSGDHASISTNSQSRFNAPISNTARPDSPALGSNNNVTVQGPTLPNIPPADHRIVSGLSNISQGERAHLRNISDATVSTATDVDFAGQPVDTAPAAAPITPIAGSAVPMTPPGPVSPPTAGADERTDYFQGIGSTLSTSNNNNNNNNSGASQLRKSVFVESQDDLRDDKGKR